jgi:hypothetical protein
MVATPLRCSNRSESRQHDFVNGLLTQRRIDILKGRNGETGRFATRWDWSAMRFEEVLDGPSESISLV